MHAPCSISVLLQWPIGYSRARCLVPQPMPLSSGKPPGRLRCEAGKVASRPAGPRSETLFCFCFFETDALKLCPRPTGCGEYCPAPHLLDHMAGAHAQGTVAAGSRARPRRPLVLVALVAAAQAPTNANKVMCTGSIARRAALIGRPNRPFDQLLCM